MHWVQRQLLKFSMWTVATQDTKDSNSAVENYLDIEVIASGVPQATITLYFVHQIRVKVFMMSFRQPFKIIMLYRHHVGQ